MTTETKASLEHELTRKAYSHDLYISDRAYQDFTADEQAELDALGAQSAWLGDMRIYNFDADALEAAGVKLPRIPTS